MHNTVVSFDPCQVKAGRRCYLAEETGELLGALSLADTLPSAPFAGLDHDGEAYALRGGQTLLGGAHTTLLVQLRGDLDLLVRIGRLECWGQHVMHR